MTRDLPIEFVDVSARIDDLDVVTHIYLEVAAGEIVALHALDHTDPTPVLELAAGRAVPTNGSVAIFGASMPAQRQQVAVRCSVVIGEPTVFPFLTASENLELIARANRIHRPVRTARVALGQVGLERWSDNRVSTLRRSQRRALGLARAMLERPEVVIAEDPFQGTSTQDKNAIVALLHGLATRGAAILLSCSDARLAARCAHRVLDLEDGHLASGCRASRFLRDATGIGDMPRTSHRRG